MGRAPHYVKSFRIDYGRDENWHTFYPNRDFETVSKNVRVSVRALTRIHSRKMSFCKASVLKCAEGYKKLLSPYH